MSTKSPGYSLIEILFVLALLGTLSGIAVPMAANSIRHFKISGDARGLAGTMALAKLRAAATLSRARVYIDLNGRSYRVETQRPGTSGWAADGGTLHLAAGVTWDYGSLSSGPPGTEGSIAQAPPCRDAGDTPIDGTACVLFNSRGIPVDATGSPTGGAVVYVTDGMAVNGVTVSTAGSTEVWQSPPSSAAWVKQ
jgi:prepilin-type N-terminal cleavage/methylation domain-containing protein